MRAQLNLVTSNGVYVMAENDSKTPPKQVRRQTDLTPEMTQDEIRHHKLMDKLITSGLALAVMFIGWMAITVHSTSVSVTYLPAVAQDIQEIKQGMAGLVTKQELEIELAALREQIGKQDTNLDVVKAKILEIEIKLAAKK